MASETGIANRALQRLGTSNRILGLSDDTRNGRACNACYQPLRDAELRKHYWNFAKKDTGPMAPDATAPLDPNYGYQYTLPSDFLRLVKQKGEGQDWLIQGRKLLTNDGNVLYVKYIAKITDPNLFDPLFCEMLSMKMAHAMCEEITQSTSKQAGIMIDYEDAKREARMANAFETIPAESEDGSWINARR